MSQNWETMQKIWKKLYEFWCVIYLTFDFFIIPAAFETVRNHIASLNQQNTDLIFLKSLIESPIVSNLVKVSQLVIILKEIIRVKIVYFNSYLTRAKNKDNYEPRVLQPAVTIPVPLFNAGICYCFCSAWILATCQSPGFMAFVWSTAERALTWWGGIDFACSTNSWIKLDLVDDDDEHDSFFCQIQSIQDHSSS